MRMWVRERAEVCSVMFWDGWMDGGIFMFVTVCHKGLYECICEMCIIKHYNSPTGWKIDSVFDKKITQKVREKLRIFTPLNYHITASTPE